MTTALWILLDDGLTEVTNPAAFIQWGVLGLVLIMLLTGWLWAKPSVEEMRTRQAEERKLWQESILPALDRWSSKMDTLSTKLDDNNKLLSELLRRRDAGT